MGVFELAVFRAQFPCLLGHHLRKAFHRFANPLGQDYACIIGGVQERAVEQVLHAHGLAGAKTQLQGHHLGRCAAHREMIVQLLMLQGNQGRDHFSRARRWETQLGLALKKHRTRVGAHDEGRTRGQSFWR